MQSEKSVPCQPSGRHVIPSGPSSVHCSIRPDDLPYRPDAQTDLASFVRTTWISVRTLHCIEKLLFQLAPVQTSKQPIRTTTSDQSASDFLSKVQIREDWCNSPDDVDFRPNALIHKARITIQIQPSGRQSTWSGRVFNRYGNCVFNFNRPDACLSWSGRALIWYGNCVLKINRPDDHPRWSGCVKSLYGNYLQRTYDRPDDSPSPFGRSSQTGKIFSENLKNTVVHPDGPGLPSGRHPYISLQSPIWTFIL